MSTLLTASSIAVPKVFNLNFQCVFDYLELVDESLALLLDEDSNVLCENMAAIFPRPFAIWFGLEEQSPTKLSFSDYDSNAIDIDFDTNDLYLVRLDFSSDEMSPIKLKFDL